MLEKLKKIADQAKVKAGPMAEQAKEKATVLAAEAKVKAAPMAEQAKERATELASKAAPAVSQGVGKAAGSLDKATKGRYTEHIDKVQGVVHQTAQKVGDKAAGTGTVAPPVTPVVDLGDPEAVIIQPPSPVVIPSEPVVVTPPAPVFESEPRLDPPTIPVDGHEDKPQI
jgi:MT0933-like antitoxin protein